MVKFGRVVFELCKRTNGQTPDKFITILRISNYGIVECDVILLHYFHYIRAYRQADQITRPPYRRDVIIWAFFTSSPVSTGVGDR